MGMFDYVKCDHPLPDGWDERGNVVGLQTKAFDCAMTTVWLRADGRLLIQDFEYEEVPREERPYPDATEGWRSICGILRRTNECWRDLNFHGVFDFGGLETVGKEPPDERGYARPIYRSHDYLAKFTNGQLVEITLGSEQQAA